jgi:hypothetical protein
MQITLRPTEPAAAIATIRTSEYRMEGYNLHHKGTSVQDGFLAKEGDRL